MMTREILLGMICMISLLLANKGDSELSLIPRLENNMATTHEGCRNASCVAMATLLPMKALKIFFTVLQWKHFVLVSDSEDRFLEISEVFSQAYVETLLYVESSGKILRKWLESKCPTRFSHSSHSINVVVMCSQNCVTRLFEEADEFEARNKTCGIWMAGRWLIFIGPTWSRDPYTWSLDTVMTNVAIYFESVVERQQKSKSRCIRPIYALLWKSKRRELSATAYLGVNETGEFTVSGTIFANEKYGFNGQQLVFATKRWLYYIHDEVTNGTKVWSGLYIDILDDLRQRLNFSYILKEPADDSWGVDDSTGHWNGIVGMISNMEADVGWVPYEVTSERYQQVDFSSPTHYTATSFVYKPPALDERWRLLFVPFTWQVYACLMASMVLTVFLLMVVRRTTRAPREPVVVTLQRCAFAIIGLDGGEEDLRVGAGRILTCSWFLTALVVSAAYSGSLVADLSVTRRQTLFRSLEDVVNQNEYKWGTLGNASTHIMIMRSSIPVYQKARAGLERFYRDDPTILSGDDKTQYQKVIGEKYVFLGLRDTLEVWANKDCGLVIGNEPLKVSMIAPAFPKGSTLTDCFSKAFEDLRANGLLEVWTRKWQQKSNCMSDVKTSAAISLEHVQGVFYAAASGLGLSAFTLVMELCSRWLQKRRVLKRNI